MRSCPQGQEGATWEKRHKVWQQGLWESKTTVDMLIQSLTPRSRLLQHKPDLVTQESFMAPTTHRQRSKQDWRSFPPVLTENLPCDRLPECISCSSPPHSSCPSYSTRQPLWFLKTSPHGQAQKWSPPKACPLPSPRPCPPLRLLFTC